MPTVHPLELTFSPYYFANPGHFRHLSLATPTKDEGPIIKVEGGLDYI